MARERYITEFDQTKTEFLYMGQLAQEAFQAALRALGDCDDAAARAHILEGEIDNLNRTIFDACLSLDDITSTGGRRRPIDHRHASSDSRP